MKQSSLWPVIRVLVALQFAAPVASANPYDSAAMRAKVLKAVPTDEITVVVHQLAELETPTLSVLDEPPYLDSPRVMLTDGVSYPLPPSFVDRATLVQHSLLGELSLNVDAQTVTLIGGSCSQNVPIYCKTIQVVWKGPFRTFQAVLQTPPGLLQTFPVSLQT